MQYYYYYYYYYNYRFTANWTVSGTTRVSRYQKGKTILVKPIWIYWSKRSEWQWHQLGICPTNSVKALKAHQYAILIIGQFLFHVMQYTVSYKLT